MATRTDPIYLAHASPDTVPQGRLLTDLAPRTLLRASQVMFFKHTLGRKKLPVRLGLDRYRSASFKYDTTSAVQVHQRLVKHPLTSEGVRWIYKEDGAYFYGVRDFDLPYDEFVRRVDVSRVGDCFRDVLGIHTQVLHRDEAGRPLLQVERIAALAQPNYAAFLGKDELDVYKLECMEYGPDEQRNWMRTVCSPNGSTRADDGYMAFQRRPDGGTRIEFVANQSFPLPRIMVFFRLDRWVWFKTFLTRNAYRVFWRETLDNILARHAGKDFAIGRAPRARQADGAVVVRGSEPSPGSKG